MAVQVPDCVLEWARSPGIGLESYFRLRGSSLQEDDSCYRIFFISQHRATVQAGRFQAVMTSRGNGLQNGQYRWTSRQETQLAPGLISFQSIENMASRGSIAYLARLPLWVLDWPEGPADFELSSPVFFTFSDAGFLSFSAAFLYDSLR